MYPRGRQTRSHASGMVFGMQTAEQTREEYHDAIRTSVNAARSGEEVAPIRSLVDFEISTDNPQAGHTRRIELIVTWRPQVWPDSSVTIVVAEYAPSKAFAQAHHLETLRRDLQAALYPPWEGKPWRVGHVVLPPAKQ